MWLSGSWWVISPSLLTPAADLNDPSRCVSSRCVTDSTFSMNWKLLELRPLVVRSRDRNLGLDGLLDFAHSSLLSLAVLNCRPTRLAVLTPSRPLLL